MEVKKFEMSKNFVLLGLRNSGYTNNTAIADIMDNSLEKDVNAKNINVAFDLETAENGKQLIRTISVIDDGRGMTEEELAEAMRLGSKTNKNDKTLGKYGSGMKTAAISMGRCLSVYTKTKDGELLLACLDLDYGDENDDYCCVLYETIGRGTKEYRNFIRSVGKEHGTIVAISKLDKLTSPYFDTFKERHLRYLRLYFNKFIEEGKINLYFNNEKMEYYDVIGQKSGFCTELLGEKEFEYKGVVTRLKAWYLPNIKKYSKDKVEENYLGRSITTQGLYIYRNNRLVGWGLNLGVISGTARDGYYSGFRVELFLDGSSDNIFGTTFLKMVTEKDKSMLDTDYLDLLGQEISEYRLYAYQQGKRDAQKEEQNISDETKNILDNVTEIINNNVMLSDGMTTCEKSKKSGDNNEKNKNPKKQKHPNPIKKRNNKWFGGYKFEANGETNAMYYSKIEGGVYWIVFNTDHVYYREFFSNLSKEKKTQCALMIGSSIRAKKQLGYYSDDESTFREMIDNYESVWSDKVRIAYTTT